ncbi:hypothetical protein B5F22_10115 [Pseudoflavonifractor sp. An187]|nr:hypothetical protein B5F22_10115 [Pseudoflavonifractor sp. An187]
MRKMKRNILLGMLLLFIFGMVSGCTTSSSKTYTFTVDNGDIIKITLDTADGYDISSNVPFEISCDGEALSQGSFIQGEAYQQYVDVVNKDENAELLDSGEKDGNSYIFWCYNKSEYNYAVLVNGSDTGVILGNTTSADSARECFERMIIKVEEN